MFQEAPGFEQRLADLQAQIDRLTIALQLWRDGQERLTPPDERLARFADDVSDVLQEWSAIGDRHARAVEALEQQVEAFASAEARLHAESAQRFLTLERMVQQEWAVSRHLDFEAGAPAREQAAALTHACIVATHARVSPASGVPAAGGAEADLQHYFSQVVTTPPRAASGAVPATVAPEPEAVERPATSPEPAPGAADIANGAPAPVAAPTPAPTVSAAPDAHVADVGGRPMSAPLHPEYLPNAEAEAARAELLRRMTEMRVLFRESMEQAVDQQDAQQRSTRRMLIALACAGVLLAAGGVWWVLGVQRQVTAALVRVAEVEAAAARSQAAMEQELATTRAESARMAAAARAAEADIAAVSAVLASPDLVRYVLTGLDNSTIAAQLLWSRSRGLVMNASGLPPLAADQSYQAWLLTEADAVSAGVLQVTPDGRGGLLNLRPPAVPRPVVGVSITLEPGASSATPTGRIVALNRLARAIP